MISEYYCSKLVNMINIVKLFILSIFVVSLSDKESWSALTACNSLVTAMRLDNVSKFREREGGGGEGGI